MKKNALVSMAKIFSLMLLSILILSSFTAVLSVVSASSALIEDTWNTKASMSQARYGLGAVTVDGKIYAIGGQTDEQGSYVGTNERYDPKKDTWTTLESMPTPRAYFGIVAYNGKIYCIDDDGGPTEVYDVATNKWSTKTPLPSSGSSRHAYGVQTHVVDEKIFVLVSSLLYIYDPVADSWTQKASLPKTGLQTDPYIYSVVVDNQIIVITTDEGPKVLIYDSNTDVWSKGKTAGYDSGFAIAVAVATSGSFAPQKIYFLSSGPSIFFYPTGYVGVYDPLSGIWEQPIEDPIRRARFGVAVLDDVIYVMGGLALLGTKGDREVLAVNEQYVPIGYHGTGFTDSESPVDNRVIIGAIVGVVIVVAVAVSLLLFFKNKLIKN